MDTITGISLSNDGSYLLSNSMDQTIRCWDVRPFVVGQRCVKIFQGASHHFDKNLLRVCWSKDGKMISAGSSDKFTYIWDTTNRKILHKLGGHKGSVIFYSDLLNFLKVNETHFSPVDDIIVSCSTDKTMYLGYIPEVGLL